MILNMGTGIHLFSSANCKAWSRARWTSAEARNVGSTASIAPLLNTKIISAWITVDKRWAIMKEVRFLISTSVAFVINRSLSVSRWLVASSKIKILDHEEVHAHTDTLTFTARKFDSTPPTTVSYRWSIFIIKSCANAVFEHFLSTLV